MIEANSRYFVDSNVFIYCAGDNAHLKDAATRIFEAVRDAQSLIVCSTAILEEVHFICYRQTMDRRRACAIVRDIVRSVAEVFPVTLQDTLLALELFRQTSLPTCSVKDYYHIACMINHEVPFILSFDADFDQFKTVRRINPLER